MTSDFTFNPTPDGLIVLMDGERPKPVGEWTSHPGAWLAAGTLIRLRDEGGAVEQDDGRSLLVSWESVAGLTSEELRYIGLPDAAPYALEVVTNGTIHDAGFEIYYGFIRKGRRVVGVEREGAWLWAGGDECMLLAPLHAIADAIDEFNKTDDTDLESRMLRWGRIAEMLPTDVIVDDHLRTLNIVVASSFELDPFINEDGEPDFNPVVGRRETRVTEVEEVEDEEQLFVRALPEARQREFARRFRGLSRVKHRYSVGGNFFVVLTPEVERALVAVRRAQDGTAEERRNFLQNVSGYLRGAFDSVGDNAIDVDSVFSDDGLSDRVRGIGIWAEKILPWIKRAAEPWLPPEKLGLRIGSRFVSIEPDDLPGLLEAVQIAVERGDPTVRAGEGIDIPADSTTIRAIEELIRRTQPVQRPKHPRESPNGPGESDDHVLLIIDNLEDVQFRRERRKRTPGVLTATPPLLTEPLPHQKEGLAWLKHHWHAGSWGALLADDMGLGKTLEALAFLSSLKTHAAAKGLKHQPMLVVAPTGLLRNWLDEHQKHLSEPGLGQAVEAHGAGLRQIRIDMRATGSELGTDPPLPKLNVETLKKAEWVLTTYETLRDYQHSFGRVHWRAAVFDEAQKIKNPGARLTDAALAMNVDFVLLMTGTPVENRPADIWSILDRAEPGMFGTLKEFSLRYETPNEAGDSSLADLHRKLTAESDAPAPGAPAVMLRRLKEDHLSRLPDKQVYRRVVEMPPLQAERYEKIVLRSRNDESMLQTLQRLRSVSLHPAAPGDLDDDRYIGESARLSETFEILEVVANHSQKALLFVESLQMQDFLIGALRRRFQLPDDVLVINGAVAGRTRKARVDTFQDRKGFDVMILSPRAGGVGLTLTAANHVIHLSRWWNPAVEDQCTDRVFRIGQKRTVHVYLPLARHPRFGGYSFDLKLDSLMERKRDMNRRVLAPTAAADKDVGELYRGTMTEAREVGINIDLLEPEKFEEWVLRQLGEAGYDTRSTPRSGDRGADGLAVSPAGDEQHTIIVQCKHMQPDATCGRAAVQEVLHAIPRYEIRGAPIPMVVTNAADFTADAKRLAHHKGVRLVDRRDLSRLRTWHDNRRCRQVR